VSTRSIQGVEIVAEEGEEMSDLSKKNCQVCQNATWCKYIHPYVGFYCPGMEALVDNQKHRKEPLASDLIGEGYEGFTNRDYLDALNEGVALKVEIHDMSVEDIREMACGSDRQAISKAIMSLMWFGIPKRRILRLLGIGRTFFYEIIKEAKKDYGR
jgi:hypothetical protein